MIRLMKLWAWDKKNLPSITHAIRTAAAATASVIIARLVRMPEHYGAAIATLVVMQSTLGATLTLSIERIAATAVGASVGALEANYLEQIWLRSRFRFFSSGCCRSRFVWRRPPIVTRALRSLSLF
jgi:Fusaric acid resistance protein-like